MSVQTADIDVTEVPCSREEIKPTGYPLAVRLSLLVNGVFRPEALNCGPARGDAPPDGGIAQQLKAGINRLKSASIDLETGKIDYRRLAGSPEFADYVAAARALRGFDPAMLESREARMAFWINLYNALVIHAVIAFGVRRRITEVRGAFDRMAYIVGGYRYSAHDIEQGILRANANHPLLPGPRFGSDDPRRAFALQSRDPRTHFALVCASASCPPINFYDAENLDEQLDRAARHFINSEAVVIDRAAKTVTLSRIFSWYAGDFGAAWFGYRHQAALLRFITPYFESAANRAFIEQNAARLRIKFAPYDWNLNA